MSAVNGLTLLPLILAAFAVWAWVIATGPRR